MCIMGIIRTPDLKSKLILVHNRDEFKSRPTSVLGDLTTAGPYRIVGGRDLEYGGTWLAFRSDGAFAAVLNVRGEALESTQIKSRGSIPLNILRQSGDLVEYVMNEVIPFRLEYRPFKLVFGSPAGVFKFDFTQADVDQQVEDLHVYCNGIDDSSWPKVQKLKCRLVELRKKTHLDSSDYFSELSDTTQAPDGSLPKTGLALEVERTVSSIFVQSDTYGTRCSTVAVLSSSGWEVIERTTIEGDTQFSFHSINLNMR